MGTVKSAFDLTTSKMTEAAKSPAKKAAKPKAKPAHPPTAAMVMAAVKALKEAKGSSLPAIKKYIAANYKVTFLTDFFFEFIQFSDLCDSGLLQVDIVKLSPFVRKALKSLVE